MNGVVVFLKQLSVVVAVGRVGFGRKRISKKGESVTDKNEELKIELKEYLARTGCRQSDLAKKAGVTPVQVWRLLQGKGSVAFRMVGDQGCNHRTGRRKQKC